MLAVEWVAATRRSAETLTVKNLNDELKTAGLKYVRQKNDATEAVVRLRYKNVEHHHCICCQTKTKAGQCERSEDLTFLRPYIDFQCVAAFLLFETHIKHHRIIAAVGKALSTKKSNCGGDTIEKE